MDSKEIEKVLIKWFKLKPKYCDIEIAGQILGGKDAKGKQLLDLQVTSTAKISWYGVLGKENQYITNYVLTAEGTWKGKKIKGKGTLENMMHRVIE
ncbi:unnamed protein product [marine sediment metagenome]|uniref:Uncharacterized protein n=1 Tax=marine sediment metagenome TaxID=412755 RepID=X1JH39_9ZZZZ